MARGQRLVDSGQTNAPRGLRFEHKQYIAANGDDMPEIRNWDEMK